MEKERQYLEDTESVLRENAEIKNPKLIFLEGYLIKLDRHIFTKKLIISS
ncbi:MAG: hypothetical protein ABIR03_09365 [Ginsengibacter sp.]